MKRFRIERFIFLAKWKIELFHLRVLYLLACGRSVCFNCIIENCEEPLFGSDGRLHIVGHIVGHGK